jgi:hypothetical protein
MPSRSKWYSDKQVLLEVFVLANLAFLSVDIYLAHSVNEFRRPAEYIPLFFSLAAPIILFLGLLAGQWWGYPAAWRDLGYFVGWLAVGIGLAGVILHLDSRFFYERTIKSLVYAAPFAAPLAYTGLGLLLIMNRMVRADSSEWPRWVLLMALGGFFGNFVFSLTDHAQNGFFHWAEWIPVVSSAFAVGFLVTPFLTTAGRKFFGLCAFVLLFQAGVGLLGFYLHTAANLHGMSPWWVDNFIQGAPAFAPLLFPDLVLLAAIGLWGLQQHMPAEERAGQQAPGAAAASGSDHLPAPG